MVSSPRQRLPLRGALSFPDFGKISAKVCTEVKIYLIFGGSIRNEPKMKTPTIAQAAEALKKIGFTFNERNGCLDAPAKGSEKAGRRVRVWVTDEETPGGYLRCEVMIETVNQGFETVATFNSHAPLSMVVDCAKACTSLKF